MIDRSSKTHLVNSALLMHPPSGEPLTVHLATLDVEQKGEQIAAELHLDLMPTEWARVQSEWLFHLIPEAREPGTTGEIDPAEPVSVHVRLHPALLADLPAEPADIWGAMRDGTDRDLLATESWFALRVDQPSPEAANGPSRANARGFATTWNDEPLLDPRPTPGGLLPTVLSVFEERVWPRNLDMENGIVETPFEGENGEWRFVVMVREAMDQVICYSILEVPVPEHRLEAAMRLATLVNNRLAIGSFELDLRNGEWAFRTSIDVEGDRLSDALFANLADANLAQFDRHFAAIAAIIDKGASAEAALELVD